MPTRHTARRSIPAPCIAARATASAEELGKLAQNPIANLISVPLQNNTHFNVGPGSGTQNILNIQTVVPFRLGSDWNLITRTMFPVVTQPGFTPEQGSTTGLGDLQFSVFLSPASAAGLLWGAGAIVRAPTHSNARLGNDRWGLGPTAVALRIEPGSPWVCGALVNNLWSVGSGDDSACNNFLLQPFVNHNLPGGVYVNSGPVITANWRADGGERWTVPLGAGVGKICRFGRLPVNLPLGAYCNVAKPDHAADGQARFQMPFMFPQ